MTQLEENALLMKTIFGEDSKEYQGALAAIQASAGSDNKLVSSADSSCDCPISAPADWRKGMY